VARGRPEAARRLALAGWTFIGVGLWWSVFGVCLAWFYRGLWSQSLLELFESGAVVGIASLDVIVMLGLGMGNYLVGALHLADASQLREFRLVIDHGGVASASRPGVVVPWERIQHVVVTSGSARTRRLLVDDGAVPPEWWWVSTVRAGRGLRRLLARRGRRFLVNVPIGRLDAAERDIRDAIRYFSGERFPDPVIAPRRG
jgi:hypothetical protein